MSAGKRYARFVHYFRFKLIVRLAGKDLVVVNAVIDGCVQQKNETAGALLSNVSSIRPTAAVRLGARAYQEAQASKGTEWNAS